jgi:hypothetical protein
MLTQRQIDEAEARRLDVEINEARYARGDAWRRGALAEWEAANGERLAGARQRLRELQQEGVTQDGR